MGGACFIARTRKGTLAASLTPSRTSRGCERCAARRTSAQLWLPPPEERGPGRVSTLRHLRPQGRQQRQLQAQAGDHTVTRAHGCLHLTFGDHYFSPSLQTLHGAPSSPILLTSYPNAPGLHTPFLNCQRQDPKWAPDAKSQIWSQQFQVLVPPSPGRGRGYTLSSGKTNGL